MKPPEVGGKEKPESLPHEPAQRAEHMKKTPDLIGTIRPGIKNLVSGLLKKIQQISDEEETKDTAPAEDIASEEETSPRFDASAKNAPIITGIYGEYLEGFDLEKFSKEGLTEKGYEWGGYEWTYRYDPLLSYYKITASYMGHPIGSLEADIPDAGTSAVIDSFNVSEKLRGRGIGGAMRRMSGEFLGNKAGIKRLTIWLDSSPNNYKSATPQSFYTHDGARSQWNGAAKVYVLTTKEKRAKTREQIKDIDPSNRTKSFLQEHNPKLFKEIALGMQKPREGEAGTGSEEATRYLEEIGIPKENITEEFIETLEPQISGTEGDKPQTMPLEERKPPEQNPWQWGSSGNPFEIEIESASKLSDSGEAIKKINAAVDNIASYASETEGDMEVMNPRGIIDLIDLLEKGGHTSRQAQNLRDALEGYMSREDYQATVNVGSLRKVLSADYLDDRMGFIDMLSTINDGMIGGLSEIIPGINPEDTIASAVDKIISGQKNARTFYAYMVRPPYMSLEEFKQAIARDGFILEHCDLMQGDAYYLSDALALANQMIKAGSSWGYKTVIMGYAIEKLREGREAGQDIEELKAEVMKALREEWRNAKSKHHLSSTGGEIEIPKGEHVLNLNHYTALADLFAIPKALDVSVSHEYAFQPNRSPMQEIQNRVVKKYLLPKDRLYSYHMSCGMLREKKPLSPRAIESVTETTLHMCNAAAFLFSGDDRLDMHPEIKDLAKIHPKFSKQYGRVEVRVGNVYKGVERPEILGDARDADQNALALVRCMGSIIEAYARKDAGTGNGRTDEIIKIGEEYTKEMKEILSAAHLLPYADIHQVNPITTYDYSKLRPDDFMEITDEEMYEEDGYKKLKPIIAIPFSPEHAEAIKVSRDVQIEINERWMSVQQAIAECVDRTIAKLNEIERNQAPAYSGMVSGRALNDVLRGGILIDGRSAKISEAASFLQEEGDVSYLKRGSVARIRLGSARNMLISRTMLESKFPGYLTQTDEHLYLGGTVNYVSGQAEILQMADNLEAGRINAFQLSKAILTAAAAQATDPNKTMQMQAQCMAILSVASKKYPEALKEGMEKSLGKIRHGMVRGVIVSEDRVIDLMDEAVGIGQDLKDVSYAAALNPSAEAVAFASGDYAVSVEDFLLSIPLYEPYTGPVETVSRAAEGIRTEARRTRQPLNVKDAEDAAGGPYYLALIECLPMSGNVEELINNLGSFSPTYAERIGERSAKSMLYAYRWNIRNFKGDIDSANGRLKEARSYSLQNKLDSWADWILAQDGPVAYEDALSQAKGNEYFHLARSLAEDVPYDRLSKDLKKYSGYREIYSSMHADETRSSRYRDAFAKIVDSEGNPYAHTVHDVESTLIKAADALLEREGPVKLFLAKNLAGHQNNLYIMYHLVHGTPVSALPKSLKGYEKTYSHLLARMSENPRDPLRLKLGSALEKVVVGRGERWELKEHAIESSLEESAAQLSSSEKILSLEDVRTILSSHKDHYQLITHLSRLDPVSSLGPYLQKKYGNSYEHILDRFMEDSQDPLRMSFVSALSKVSGQPAEINVYRMEAGESYDTFRKKDDLPGMEQVNVVHRVRPGKEGFAVVEEIYRIEDLSQRRIDRKTGKLKKEENEHKNLARWIKENGIRTTYKGNRCYISKQDVAAYSKYSDGGIKLEEPAPYRPYGITVERRDDMVKKWKIKVFSDYMKIVNDPRIDLRERSALLKCADTIFSLEDAIKENGSPLPKGVSSADYAKSLKRNIKEFNEKNKEVIDYILAQMPQGAESILEAMLFLDYISRSQRWKRPDGGHYMRDAVLAADYLLFAVKIQDPGYIEAMFYQFLLSRTQEDSLLSDYVNTYILIKFNADEEKIRKFNETMKDITAAMRVQMSNLALPLLMPLDLFIEELERRVSYEGTGVSGLEAPCETVVKTMVSPERYIVLKDANLLKDYSRGILWMGYERAEEVLSRPEYSKSASKIAVDLSSGIKGKVLTLESMNESDKKAIRDLIAANGGKAFLLDHPKEITSRLEVTPEQQEDYESYLMHVKEVFLHSKTAIFVQADESVDGGVIKTIEEIASRLDIKVPVVVIPTVQRSPEPIRTGWPGMRKTYKELGVKELLVGTEFYKSRDYLVENLCQDGIKTVIQPDLCYDPNGIASTGEQTYGELLDGKMDGDAGIFHSQPRYDAKDLDLFESRRMELDEEIKNLTEKGESISPQIRISAAETYLKIAEITAYMVNYELVRYSSSKNVKQRFEESSRLYNDAVSSFLQAAEIDKKNPSAYAGAGRAYYNTWKYSEAIEMLKKAVELNPQDTESWIHLGYAYTKANNYPEAGKCFERAGKTKQRLTIPVDLIGRETVAVGFEDKSIPAEKREELKRYATGISENYLVRGAVVNDAGEAVFLYEDNPRYVSEEQTASVVEGETRGFRHIEDRHREEVERIIGRKISDNAFAWMVLQSVHDKANYLYPPKKQGDFTLYVSKVSLETDTGETREVVLQTVVVSDRQRRFNRIITSYPIERSFQEKNIKEHLKNRQIDDASAAQITETIISSLEKNAVHPVDYESAVRDLIDSCGKNIRDPRTVKTQTSLWTRQNTILSGTAYIGDTPAELSTEQNEKGAVRSAHAVSGGNAIPIVADGVYLIENIYETDDPRIIKLELKEGRGELILSKKRFNETFKRHPYGFLRNGRAQAMPHEDDMRTALDAQESADKTIYDILSTDELANIVQECKKKAGFTSRTLGPEKISRLESSGQVKKIHSREAKKAVNLPGSFYLYVPTGALAEYALSSLESKDANDAIQLRQRLVLLGAIDLKEGENLDAELKGHVSESVQEQIPPETLTAWFSSYFPEDLLPQAEKDYAEEKRNSTCALEAFAKTALKHPAAENALIGRLSSAGVDSDSAPVFLRILAGMAREDIRRELRYSDKRLNAAIGLLGSSVGTVHLQYRGTRYSVEPSTLRILYNLNSPREVHGERFDKNSKDMFLLDPTGTYVVARATRGNNKIKEDYSTRDRKIPESSKVIDALLEIWSDPQADVKAEDLNRLIEEKGGRPLKELLAEDYILRTQLNLYGFRDRLITAQGAGTKHNSGGSRKKERAAPRIVKRDMQTRPPAMSVTDTLLKYCDAIDEEYGIKGSVNTARAGRITGNVGYMLIEALAEITPEQSFQDFYNNLPNTAKYSKNLETLQHIFETAKTDRAFLQRMKDSASKIVRKRTGRTKSPGTIADEPPQYAARINLRDADETDAPSFMESFKDLLDIKVVVRREEADGWGDKKERSYVIDPAHVENYAARSLRSLQGRGFISSKSIAEQDGKKLSSVYAGAIISRLKEDGKLTALPSSINHILPEEQKGRSSLLYLPDLGMLSTAYEYTKKHEIEKLPGMMEALSRTLTVASINAPDSYPIEDPLVKEAWGRVIDKEPGYVCDYLGSLCERSTNIDGLNDYFSGDAGCAMASQLAKSMAANPSLFKKGTKARGRMEKTLETLLEITANDRTERGQKANADLKQAKTSLQISARASKGTSKNKGDGKAKKTPAGNSSTEKAEEGIAEAKVILFELQELHRQLTDTGTSDLSKEDIIQEIKDALEMLDEAVELDPSRSDECNMIRQDLAVESRSLKNLLPEDNVTLPEGSRPGDVQTGETGSERTRNETQTANETRKTIDTTALRDEAASSLHDAATKAQELDSNIPDGRKAEVILQVLASFQSALDCLNEALKKDPLEGQIPEQKAQALYEMGAFQERIGMKKAARNTYEELSKQPLRSEQSMVLVARASDRMVRLLAEAGDYSGAANALNIRRSALARLDPGADATRAVTDEDGALGERCLLSARTYAEDGRINEALDAAETGRHLLGAPKQGVKEIRKALQRDRMQGTEAKEQLYRILGNVPEAKAGAESNRSSTYDSGSLALAEARLLLAKTAEGTGEKEDAGRFASAGRLLDKALTELSAAHLSDPADRKTRENLMEARLEMASFQERVGMPRAATALYEEVILEKHRTEKERLLLVSAHERLIRLYAVRGDYNYVISEIINKKKLQEGQEAGERTVVSSEDRAVSEKCLEDAIKNAGCDNAKALNALEAGLYLISARTKGVRDLRKARKDTSANVIADRITSIAQDTLGSDPIFKSGTAMDGSGASYDRDAVGRLSAEGLVDGLWPSGIGEQNREGLVRNAETLYEQGILSAAVLEDKNLARQFITNAETVSGNYHRMTGAYDVLCPNWKVEPLRDASKLLSEHLVLGDLEYMLLKIIREEPGLPLNELKKRVDEISGAAVARTHVWSMLSSLRASENEEIRLVAERHDTWTAPMQKQYQMLIDHPGLTEKESAELQGMSEAAIDSRMVRLNERSKEPGESLLREDLERHREWRKLGVGMIACLIERQPELSMDNLAEKLGTDPEKARQIYARFKELAERDYAAADICERRKKALGVDAEEKGEGKEIHIDTAWAKVLPLYELICLSPGEPYHALAEALEVSEWTVKEWMTQLRKMSSDPARPGLSQAIERHEAWLGVRDLSMIIKKNPGLAGKELAKKLAYSRTTSALEREGIAYSPEYLEGIIDDKYDVFRAAYRKLTKLAKTDQDAAEILSKHKEKAGIREKRIGELAKSREPRKEKTAKAESKKEGTGEKKGKKKNPEPAAEIEIIDAQVLYKLIKGALGGMPGAEDELQELGRHNPAAVKEAFDVLENGKRDPENEIVWKNLVSFRLMRSRVTKGSNGAKGKDKGRPPGWTVITPGAIREPPLTIQVAEDAYALSMESIKDDCVLMADAALGLTRMPRRHVILGSGDGSCYDSPEEGASHIFVNDIPADKADAALSYMQSRDASFDEFLPEDMKAMLETCILNHETVHSRVRAHSNSLGDGVHQALTGADRIGEGLAAYGMVEAIELFASLKLRAEGISEKEKAYLNALLQVARNFEELRPVIGIESNQEYAEQMAKVKKGLDAGMSLSQVYQEAAASCKVQETQITSNELVAVDDMIEFSALYSSARSALQEGAYPGKEIAKMLSTLAYSRDETVKSAADDALIELYTIHAKELDSIGRKKTYAGDIKKTAVDMFAFRPGQDG